MSDSGSLPADEKQRRLEMRDRWFRSVPPENHFSQLLDELTGVFFFAKDHLGRLMFLNRAARERCGLRDDTDVIGLRDVELIPDFLQTESARNEARILATGESVRGCLELWFDANGIPDWYVVTKLPIRSRSGKIVGVMGISTHYQQVPKYSSTSEGLTQVVDYIRQHFAKTLTIPMLAQVAQLSPRQLERQFRATFDITPKQFLIRTRLSVACRALRQTQASLADIAADCGFYDQSALTLHFHQSMGLTPGQYRRNEAGSH
ncbi:AraC family transcriptional regulator [Schlesneria paludicola]|uniref:AraC family transcriptional regulator n=1 Tax=Schlesneria paludicola TaxID=360056 RepID=UPI0002DE458D|nr:AraC family transcriptional regulator [Schlesneria paludicola]